MAFRSSNASDRKLERIHGGEITAYAMLRSVKWEAQRGLVECLPSMLRHLREDGFQDPTLFLRQDHAMDLRAGDLLRSFFNNQDKYFDMAVKKMQDICTYRNPHILACVVRNIVEFSADPLISNDVCLRLLIVSSSLRQIHRRERLLAVTEIIEDMSTWKFEVLGAIISFFRDCATPKSDLARCMGPVFLLREGVTLAPKDQRGGKLPKLVQEQNQINDEMAASEVMRVLIDECKEVFGVVSTYVPARRMSLQNQIPASEEEEKSLYDEEKNSYQSSLYEGVSPIVRRKSKPKKASSFYKFIARTTSRGSNSSEADESSSPRGSDNRQQIGHIVGSSAKSDESSSSRPRSDYSDRRSDLPPRAPSINNRAVAMDPYNKSSKILNPPAARKRVESVEEMIQRHRAESGRSSFSKPNSEYSQDDDEYYDSDDNSNSPAAMRTEGRKNLSDIRPTPLQINSGRNEDKFSSSPALSHEKRVESRPSSSEPVSILVKKPSKNEPASILIKPPGAPEINYPNPMTDHVPSNIKKISVVNVTGERKSAASSDSPQKSVKIVLENEEVGKKNVSVSTTSDQQEQKNISENKSEMKVSKPQETSQNDVSSAGRQQTLENYRETVQQQQYHSTPTVAASAPENHRETVQQQQYLATAPVVVLAEQEVVQQQQYVSSVSDTPASNQQQQNIDVQQQQVYQQYYEAQQQQQAYQQYYEAAAQQQAYQYAQQQQFQQQQLEYQKQQQEQQEYQQKQQLEYQKQQQQQLEYQQQQQQLEYQQQQQQQLEYQQQQQQLEYQKQQQQQLEYQQQQQQQLEYQQQQQQQLEYQQQQQQQLAYQQQQQQQLEYQQQQLAYQQQQQLAYQQQYAAASNSSYYDPNLTYQQNIEEKADETQQSVATPSKNKFEEELAAKRSQVSSVDWQQTKFKEDMTVKRNAPVVNTRKQPSLTQESTEELSIFEKARVESVSSTGSTRFEDELKRRTLRSDTSKSSVGSPNIEKKKPETLEQKIAARRAAVDNPKTPAILGAAPLKPPPPPYPKPKDLDRDSSVIIHSDEEEAARNTSSEEDDDEEEEDMEVPVLVSAPKKRMSMEDEIAARKREMERKRQEAQKAKGGENGVRKVNLEIRQLEDKEHIIESKATKPDAPRRSLHEKLVARRIAVDTGENEDYEKKIEAKKVSNIGGELPKEKKSFDQILAARKAATEAAVENKPTSPPPSTLNEVGETKPKPPPYPKPKAQPEPISYIPKPGTSPKKSNAEPSSFVPKTTPSPPSFTSKPNPTSPRSTPAPPSFIPRPKPVPPQRPSITSLQRGSITSLTMEQQQGKIKTTGSNLSIHIEDPSLSDSSQGALSPPSAGSNNEGAELPVDVKLANLRSLLKKNDGSGQGSGMLLKPPVVSVPPPSPNNKSRVAPPKVNPPPGQPILEKEGPFVILGDWRSEYSPEHRMQFWVNMINGQVQWENPQRNRSLSNKNREAKSAPFSVESAQVTNRIPQKRNTLTPDTATVLAELQKEDEEDEAAAIAAAKARGDTVVECLYDFTPKNPKNKFEMPIRKGEKLILYEKGSDGWWGGKKARDETQKGLFPQNYVKIIT